jgi:hypothetical protein
MTRRAWISVFVAAWVALFHYESLRLNYLSPRVLRIRSGWAPQEAGAPSGQELPKFKFLYPPAGWIMFFQVDPTYGLAEVYGIRDGRPERIDPHAVFATRAVWYDNIRRNVLVSVLSPQDAAPFCRFLARKFPQYDAFAVTYAVYPDLVGHPGEKYAQVAYRCP